jgi:hypothetical protein
MINRYFLYIILFLFVRDGFSEKFYCSEKINKNLCDSLNNTQLDKYGLIVNRNEIDSMKLEEITAYNDIGIETLNRFPDDNKIISKGYAYIWAKTKLNSQASPLYDPMFNAVIKGFGVVAFLWLAELSFYPYTKDYDVKKVAIVSGIIGGITIPIGIVSSRKYYRPEVEIRFKFK